MDEIILKANQLVADKTVFISEWLQEYHKSKGLTNQSIVAYNGCNNKFFFPKKDKIKWCWALDRRHRTKKPTRKGKK